MGIRHGIDLVRVSRIEAAILRRGQPFLDRLWTAQEQAYCRRTDGSWRFNSLAARYAAKEAVSKALGTGLGRSGVILTSIEVLSDALGGPYVQLTGGARTRYLELGGVDIALSLSHEGELTMASCVILTGTATGAELP